MYNSRSDYKICPYCGASLDVGEKCDCLQEKQPPRMTQAGFFGARQYKNPVQTAKVLRAAKNGIKQGLAFAGFFFCPQHYKNY